MPHSKQLLPHGVVTRTGGESSNYGLLPHGRYKNVERPPVNVRHGEQVCRVRINSTKKSTSRLVRRMSTVDAPNMRNRYESILCLGNLRVFYDTTTCVCVCAQQITIMNDNFNTELHCTLYNNKEIIYDIVHVYILVGSLG